MHKCHVSGVKETPGGAGYNYQTDVKPHTPVSPRLCRGFAPEFALVLRSFVQSNTETQAFFLRQPSFFPQKTSARSDCSFPPDMYKCTCLVNKEIPGRAGG